MTDRLFDPSAPPPTTRQDSLGRPIPDAAPPLTPPPGEHVVRANEHARAVERAAEREAEREAEHDLRATSPAARSTDPETSHEAAASVVQLNERRLAVLDLVGLIEPCTHEQLVERYVTADRSALPTTLFGRPLPSQTASGVRSRCTELTRTTPPLVEWTGEYAQMSTGSRARTWRLTEAGEQLWAQRRDEDAL